MTKTNQIQQSIVRLSVVLPTIWHDPTFPQNPLGSRLMEELQISFLSLTVMNQMLFCFLVFDFPSQVSALTSIRLKRVTGSDIICKIHPAAQ